MRFIIGIVAGLSLMYLGMTYKVNENNQSQINNVKAESDEACTNPYFKTVIDGVTYSGSTEVAHQAYVELGEKLKKVLYDENLKEDDRWKRVATIQERMDGLNKYRCKCKKYGMPVKILSNGKKDLPSCLP